MLPTTPPAAAAATARTAAAAASRRAIAARHLTTTRIARAAIKRPVAKPGAASNPTPAPAASPIFPTVDNASDVLDASPVASAAAEPGSATISADALLPSASLLADWRAPTRRPRLMIADAGVTKILDTVDAILGDRTTQEVLKDQDLDKLTAQVRTAEPDSRQWSLLAEVLLAQHPFNIQRAYLLYELARHAGDFNGEYAVARLYLKEKDPTMHQRADQLLHNLAARGHPPSQLLLGAQYVNAGKTKQAIELFETAATNGVKDAWLELGRVHMHAKNPTSALAAFDRAITAGDPRGHHYRAESLKTQRPLPVREIVQCMQRAAEAGVPESQFNLGVMYLAGYHGDHAGGVKQDLSRAKQWFELAAAVGYPPAAFNVAVVALKQGQVERAKRLFAECVEKYPAVREAAQAELSKLEKSTGGTSGKQGDRSCVIM
ncbi:hypothetical protein AMAG_13495 [Allomyces macrogynus ATCC 38327]|uniref:Uncharacterized protein n=1 Tax=Allomyces macrogynus (strain ATCC 38327) TaxID=578462 RepID=A0A0L0T2H4_ALLM3|nr:hypothetical protein AMAG_13495 [Allomyces macrogynus ATCC 38327]|eukprot:KNE68855.1 hypothetical protein AMAG_13495 [Allomyces macrogynus ATCC 38327]